ncbi:MAG: hypothetical protein MUE53_07120 [Chitinophagales bacterium]|jgi:hypothetical protein|nr:hypothetical protein [Chitinophagales bacterium]
MKKTFSKLYPYLGWWLDNQGYMQLGYDGDAYESAILWLIDEGGEIYRDEESTSIDEALKKAEKFVREEEIPERFGQKVADEIKKSLK